MQKTLTQVKKHKEDCTAARIAAQENTRMAARKRRAKAATGSQEDAMRQATNRSNDSNDSNLTTSTLLVEDSNNVLVGAMETQTLTPVSREEDATEQRRLGERTNGEQGSASVSTYRMSETETKRSSSEISTNDDGSETEEAAKELTVSQEDVTQQRMSAATEGIRERTSRMEEQEERRAAIDDMADDARLCEELRERRENEDPEVSVAEYWQVRKTSLSDTMELFLRLFLPKSGVTQKNKPIKWMTLNEKVIQQGLLTKPQFDSRVEDLVRRLRTIEIEIKGLEPDAANETDEPGIDEAS